MFPITSRISHLQRIFCCVFRKHGETAQEQSFSLLQSSKGERSNILLGRCEQHPIHTTDAAHFPGCHQKVSLCHMVYKIPRKVYGILQTRHTDVCLDKADGVCRREVDTARLPAVTLPCLECLITHIHSYLYYYPYYFIYIAILLYWCIDVLLYCLISTLLYICIVILFYISIVYNKAIYLFLYLYFYFRFLCSTSIF